MADLDGAKTSLSTLVWLIFPWRLYRLSRPTSRTAARSRLPWVSSGSGANDSLLVRFFLPPRCFLRRPVLALDEEAVSGIGAGEALRGALGFAGLEDWSRGIVESGEKGLPDMAAAVGWPAGPSAGQGEAMCGQQRGAARARQAKSAWRLSWTQRGAQCGEVRGGIAK